MEPPSIPSTVRRDELRNREARLMFRETLTAFGEGKMRVELDKRALFALASDTRLDILRALQPMRRTVTQLAESLSIDKAAIHRHLKMLEEGGFVKRYDDHGFVYYGLSWKARDLISPNENTRVVILLSSSLVAFGVAMMLIIAALSVVGFGGNTRIEPTDGSQGGEDYAAESIASPMLLFFIASGFAVLLGIAMVVVATRKARVPKQRQAFPAERPSLARDEGHGE